jgi:hypothetical protein
MKQTLTPCEVINIAQAMKMPKVSTINTSAEGISLMAVSMALEKKATKEQNKTLLMLSLLYKLIAKRILTGI